MTEPISGGGKPVTQQATLALTEPPGPAVTAAVPQSGSRARPLRALVNLLHDLAIAAVICVFLIAYVVQAFRVQGSSMAPQLQDGERILVNKFIYRVNPIERGDVVVFWYPEEPDVSFIKRVAALPGDRVEIVSGRLYINGAQIDEPYVQTELADDRSYPKREIRPGHYFVLGDNRQGSNDSRIWGLVPKRYIYGKAFFRIWPPSKIGTLD